MPIGPTFEPATGNCEVQRCPNSAEYGALWPIALKLVCKRHKEEFTDKPWPAVSGRFGSIPPK
jgi:hypothetical protein